MLPPFDTIPSRFMFIGSSGSGKTVFAVHAVLEWYPVFDQVVLFSPTVHMQSNLYGHLRDKYQDKFSFYENIDASVIEKIVYAQKVRIQLGLQAKKVLLMFDDILADPEMKVRSMGVLEKLACNGRPLNISLILIGQKMTGFSSTIRAQASLVVFKTHHELELKAIYSICGIGTFNAFKEWLQKEVWARKARNPLIYAEFPEASWFVEPGLRFMPDSACGAGDEQGLDGPSACGAAASDKQYNSDAEGESDMMQSTSIDTAIDKRSANIPIERNKSPNQIPKEIAAERSASPASVARAVAPAPRAEDRVEDVIAAAAAAAAEAPGVVPVPPVPGASAPLVGSVVPAVSK